MEAEKAVFVDSVTRRFGDLVAVDKLSFTAQPGEIFGLLGPNGAGKTTTIHLITGLLKRHNGAIQILGFDPQTQAQEVRRRIGLVPQETNVYADLSGVDNLLHHAALYCEDLADIDERIESMLRLMNLWERRSDPVRTYSGGMKRRLALARALLHDPPLILFDEPTLGVDVQGKHVLWEHIKSQQAQGKTFIVSTNNMEEADKLCDRLMIIDYGKAIAMDTPEHLKAAMGRDVITLRTTPNIENPKALFKGLGLQATTYPQPDQLRLEVTNAESIVGELVARAAADHRLDAVRITRPTLDDVFLHHTGRALRE